MPGKISPLVALLTLTLGQSVFVFGHQSHHHSGQSAQEDAHGKDPLELALAPRDGTTKADEAVRNFQEKV